MKAYEMRKEITTLIVYTPTKPIRHAVGYKGVEKIEFNAGTSGVEYSVFYDTTLIQYRGNLAYEAVWSLKKENKCTN